MSKPILVGYATRYGSTQEVAEVVAGVLRDAGLNVDLRLLKDVRSLDGYAAVVMGAALYMYHWNKDALKFLPRHRDALSRLPVFVFSLGPIHDEPKEFEDARAQLDADLAKEKWFRPVEIEMFAGKFDPAKLPFPVNKMAGKEPASDARDWEAIRAWATALAGTLNSTALQSSASA
jgi:menaquinone-dependent protoporphyrinogen oxidase